MVSLIVLVIFFVRRQQENMQLPDPSEVGMCPPGFTLMCVSMSLKGVEVPPFTPESIRQMCPASYGPVCLPSQENMVLPKKVSI